MVDDRLGLYRQIDLEAKVGAASPHQLIVLLFEGLLGSLTEARAAMCRSDYAEKGRKLSRAIAILSGLRESLDLTQPLDLPRNIDLLYDYMQRRLLDANHTMDLQAVDEVVELISTLKSGWDAMDARS